MSDDVVQPVCLDATVLSNFASSAATDQLVTILERPVTVSAVQTELERDRSQGYDVLEDALDHLGGEIEVVDVRTTDSETVTGVRERLDAGEAASLRCAIDRDGTLATDDLAARRLASVQGVPVTGSVGILVLGIRRDVIEIERANEWLTTWREVRGYFSPVDRIEEALE